MLNKLNIRNFALIEDVQLNINKGFTVITGETGAGKSILLGAISLLLGKRADLSTVRDASKKCVIEAEFNISDYQLQAIFEELDIDYDDSTIIRREILPSGKSRSFVNDTPVRLAQISQLGQHLIDIHSQHQTLSIGEEDFQYFILDTIASTDVQKKKYQDSYYQLAELKKELHDLEEQQRQASAAYDYNLFLYNELDEAKLKAGEQANLEKLKAKLDNVEVLQESLSDSLQTLTHEDVGALGQLRQSATSLKNAAKYDEKMAGFSERLESVLIEVEDLTSDLEREFENVENDPELKTQVDDKLEAIYHLQNKHQVQTIEELLDIQSRLEKEIENSDNAQSNQDAIKKKIFEEEEKLKKSAQVLFKNRNKVVKIISEHVELMLKNLGIQDAQLKISGIFDKNYTAQGGDKFEWLFTANKGQELKAIKKVASGGEMSRITLAIKYLLSQHLKLPSLIFDEIDTGVSGEIAEKMGDVMLDMSENMQVISITHLPQIAAKGKTHLRVFKEVVNQKTQSQISVLSTKERVDELAEMLGSKDSESAVSHAKSLLDQ
ncbi:DNA repair protein RecN [Psychroflexus halocasei]|uniref:DNA repair protein RecN n=1 Tax=Psychroflexus halocasei TaxID=908615 RepID=A0A1H3XCE2_9FLAO|nr:DNA repair protein RecN [Psychroflexus halocasei]SDZ97047.1 DNA repair protein RecN (Recombination protein N) [Psychroflexus halocasei]